jgi:hypothetical protein
MTPFINGPPCHYMRILAATLTSHRGFGEDGDGGETVVASGDMGENDARQGPAKRRPRHGIEAVARLRAEVSGTEGVRAGVTGPPERLPNGG